jgi:hypothetical protein
MLLVTSPSRVETIRVAPSSVVQGLGGVGGGDRRALGEQHRAGIETLIHAHGGDAGLAIAGQDGAMDGRGTAPARQQRAMDVDAAQHRRIEEAFRQDVAVGHHHGGIEIERLERRRVVVALEVLRCAHRQAERVGELMHGRLAFLLATAGRFRRARIDRRHVMTRLDQRSQSGHGEFRGAEKSNLHRRLL